MTARLVPYRSLAQIHNDAAVMAMLSLPCVAVARFAVGTGNFLFLMAAVWFAILLAALLSEAIGVWRARRGGAQLLNRAEWYQRIYRERAAAPLWHSVAPAALAASFTSSLALLALVPLEYWPWIPVGSLITAVLGAVGGFYAWSYSRAYVAAAQREPQQAPAPSPFLQLAMRHYAGYSLGLAAALLAITFIADRQMAAIAVLPAFLAGKLFSDALAPVAYYDTTIEVPWTFAGLLRGAITSIVWWGLPLGALLSIQIRAMKRAIDASDCAFAFGLAATCAICFQLFVVGLLYITRGRTR